MSHLIVEISKYVIIILMAVYTYSCFAVFSTWDPDSKRDMLRNQNVLMFLLHLISFLILFMQKDFDVQIAGLYGLQVVLLATTILAYTKLYPKVSRVVLNNMCMLLTVGFIMLTRLEYELAFKQFIFAAIGIGISLVVPIIIKKLKVLSELRYIYGGVGIVSLLAVLLLAKASGGALLGFTFGGFSIQPSEFIKILLVFFVASSFKYSLSFKNIVFTTAVAALHVLILVYSTDLGAGLILFVVYLTMLYVATKQPLYLLAGGVAGAGASVLGFKLFSHVKVRVQAWQDPFANYDYGGYQVAQSLFAIATGGWLGVGLMQGEPEKIPVAESDFIFSAICEELGLIFGICLILICISVYIMFLNIAMELKGMFYRLVALGLGTVYIFQVFVMIGGVTKFIPSTGVTLPLVSYGGSSLLSTLIMFAIIQGLYILREEEENEQRKKKLRREAGSRKAGRRAGNSGNDRQRAKGL
ncbi:cell division protein FtsW (lipid II flippase) [Lachnospiraceae bacterium PF1-21]|uniref:FtsW/RodA/SpoVE family cell cycle protein n=1 Tax=Ohessyouella blattaphilus TaxID=2949333 RepID=A0ABT1EF05_9FIRM|nr:FtsW/RodA/SpoVE family cell cycle protein [Ohessyouella blattaphilus]MCP1109284.1 FtsW/RodA/SpoVE family cell cycle protein [Ohessyouella blattaphilus]MCR8562678.1 FtsW/RodA/SpoVE family cell cycle protein [Ohessyouella blattaphilus]MDL2251075.1 FtsW/RodA/SpoVE family cell cycle protein [Lachnospiraceae bacterium OttesenSCG-928-J05]